MTTTKSIIIIGERISKLVIKILIRVRSMSSYIKATSKIVLKINLIMKIMTILWYYNVLLENLSTRLFTKYMQKLN